MGYKIVGVDFANTACDCCGREDLKKVIVLDGPNGRVQMGTGCAAKAMGNRRTNREIDAKAMELTVTEIRRDAYRFGNASICRVGYGDMRRLTDGRLFVNTGGAWGLDTVQAAAPDRAWVKLNHTEWVTTA